MHHGSLEGERQLTSVQLSNEPTTKFTFARHLKFKAEDIAFPDFDKYQSTDASSVVPEIDLTLTLRARWFCLAT